MSCFQSLDGQIGQDRSRWTSDPGATGIGEKSITNPGLGKGSQQLGETRSNRDLPVPKGSSFGETASRQPQPYNTGHRCREKRRATMKHKATTLFLGFCLDRKST